MVKKLTYLDPSDSPLSSPTPLPTSSLLNKVSASALAERILNDPEAWKPLEEDSCPITDLRLSLDSRGIEEEMTWLENELKALNLPPSSSMFGEKLVSQISDTTDTFDTDSLQLKSRRTYDRFETLAAPNTKSTQQGHVTHKPRPIDLSSPHIYNPPGSLDKPRHSNEEPQGANWHVRLYHFLDRTDETRPLMGTVHGPEPGHVLSPPSPPSSESSSSSSLGSGRGFHPSDDRTTEARPVFSGLRPLPPTSGSTSFSSPSVVHPASTTLNFLEWYGIYPDSPLAKTTHAGNYRAHAGATPVQQSKVDLSQSLPGRKCDTGATPRLPGADTITSHEVGGHLPHTRIAAEKCPSVLSKDEEQNGAIDTKSKKKVAVYAQDPPKPMPTLPLPAVPSATPPMVPPKDTPPTHTETNTSREKTSDSPIRRLPALPTRSATLNFESEQSPPLVNTPSSALPHTGLHTLRRPHINTLRTKGPQTFRFTHTSIRVNNTPTATSKPSTSAITGSPRSPPSPAGPRNRHRRNNTTPTKSARQGKNNTSATVSRSVSAPRVSPHTDAQGMGNRL